MQSKYRKLYLYASNQQSMVAKKLNQTSEQYALKKQKSIEHLKQLLDIRINLPPVSQLSFSGRQNNGQANEGSRFSPYKIKRSKTKILKGNNATSTSFLLPLPNQNKSRLIINPDIRKISKSFNLSKKYAEVSKEAERQIKYQKYINQYMQSLQKSQILQKIPQQQYRNLVQQACKQIKRKIIEDQNLIKQVQKGLEESNDENNLKRGAHQKSKGLLKSSPKAKRKKLQILYHLSNEGNYKSSILKLENKLILKQNNHRKSKSVADNNLYKLTLQSIQKINQLKNKQRKRSQKQFVRHLTKSSFAQSHQGFKPQ